MAGIHVVIVHGYIVVDQTSGTLSYACNGPGNNCAIVFSDPPIYCKTASASGSSATQVAPDLYESDSPAATSDASITGVVFDETGRDITSDISTYYPYLAQTPY